MGSSYLKMVKPLCSFVYTNETFLDSKAVLSYGEDYMWCMFDALLRLPFAMFKYRDRYTIVADILKAIAKTNKGVRKTQIMQTANLNSDLINKYLDCLMLNKFILVDGYVYKLTRRGMEFVQNIDHEAMKLRYRT